MPERRRLLELALKGLEADRAQIEAEIAEVRTQLGDLSVIAKRRNVSVVSNGRHKRRRRKMSAEARQRISEAMKLRHAARRRPQQKPQLTTPARSGGLTAAGRKKLSEMMKARWAAKRRASKKAA
jgi:hypothetical protein